VTQYNLFGEEIPQLAASIASNGGSATEDGRELMLTFAFQDYMMFEAKNGILLDELVNRTLRVIARSLVMEATTVSANLNITVPEATASLYGNLQFHIEKALDDLVKAEKIKTVIHRDFTRN